jgi:mannose-6-phosphate isomerase
MVSIGQAVFVGGGRTSIEVGANGLTALIAYPGARPIDSLLRRLCEPSTQLIQPAAPDDPKWTGRAEAST